MEPIEFACPICKGPLEQESKGYICARDDRSYPVTLGIPDFRPFPHEWVESDVEQAWTALLVTEYRNRSFAELVDLYATLMPGMPADLAAMLRARFLGGVVHGQSCLAELQHLGALPATRNFLDIGCGSGGFLVAASYVFQSVVGLDISMPRLILAKKQLEDTGREAIVIWGCAESLPFVDNSFHVVVGSDVIEHVKEQVQVMREAKRVMVSGGLLFLATPNRWSLTPEPHVNVWGVGFLPKAWRASYVWRARNIPYVNVSLLNWFETRRLILQTPFERWHIIAPTFPPEHTARLPAWARAAVPLYHALKERLVLKWLVYLFGPLFHVICIKR